MSYFMVKAGELFLCSNLVSYCMVQQPELQPGELARCQNYLIHHIPLTTQSIRALKWTELNYSDADS